MLGCFLVIVAIGFVLFLVLRGKGDRPEQLGASRRPLGSGPLQPQTFACPFPKCPQCGAVSKMTQQWDGFRKVTWTCGYCGHSQVQELQDHELPESVRQRLGLDPDPRQRFQQQDMSYPGGGSGVGGLLTGMMLGSMLGGGGSHHHNEDNGWGNGGDSGGDSGGDWGSGDSGGDSGGDWGGGGNSGGGDW